MIQKIFKWIFKTELEELNSLKEKVNDTVVSLENYKRHLRNVLQNIDVSVDIEQYNKYSKSWAVISLQGSKTDFIKFIELGDRDIQHIQQFLRQFDRESNVKVDASPQASSFLKITR